jgi:hypothetical protein
VARTPKGRSPEEANTSFQKWKKKLIAPHSSEDRVKLSVYGAIAMLTPRTDIGFIDFVIDPPFPPGRGIWNRFKDQKPPKQDQWMTILQDLPNRLRKARAPYEVLQVVEHFADAFTSPKAKAPAKKAYEKMWRCIDAWVPPRARKTGPSPESILRIVAQIFSEHFRETTGSPHAAETGQLLRIMFPKATKRRYGMIKSSEKDYDRIRAQELIKSKEFRSAYRDLYEIYQDFKADPQKHSILFPPK